MHSPSTINGSKHIYIPSFNININYRDAVNNSTYLLMRNLPATSYVATTFHPTIGQLAHQTLSNAATPELGMILQGIRNKQAYT